MCNSWVPIPVWWFWGIGPVGMPGMAMALGVLLTLFREYQVSARIRMYRLGIICFNTSVVTQRVNGLLPYFLIQQPIRFEQSILTPHPAISGRYQHYPQIARHCHGAEL
ncbi:MAG: hypothetical protein ACK6C4_08635 [Bacteroidota bacterium]|jgi:hypothetical protein